jgi:hypothetical protein
MPRPVESPAVACRRSFFLFSALVGSLSGVSIGNYMTFREASEIAARISESRYNYT